MKDGLGTKEWGLGDEIKFCLGNEVRGQKEGDFRMKKMVV